MLSVSRANIEYQADSLRQVWEDESTIDTVRYNALENYFDLYNRVQPDSALMALDYYYALAKEKKAWRQLCGVLVAKANIYRDKGNLEQSKKLYLEAEAIAEQKNMPLKKATITGNLGNIFFDQKNYLEATRSYSKALEIFKVQEKNFLVALLLSNLGSVNLTVDNYNLALDYFSKASEILLKIGAKKTYIASNKALIGRLFLEQENYSKAKSFFNEALAILNQQDDKMTRSRCYASLAETHLKLNQIEIAKNYAKKNLTLTDELKNKNDIEAARILDAQVTFEFDIKSATQKAEAIAMGLSQNTSLESKNNLYELLYKCYKQQKRLDRSIEMLELHMLYQDSIQIEKNSAAVAREMILMDYDRRMYENKLKSEKEKLELHTNQFNRTFGIVSLGLIIITSLFSYYRRNEKKNRKRREELLEEVKKLKRNQGNELVFDSNKFELNRQRIETSINRSLNETDWTVLNIPLKNLVLSNKEIGEKAFLSADGIGSSLRRMYEYFEIKESKYKKISLLLKAIKISNKVSRS